MIQVAISNSTRALGRDQEEYTKLHIRDETLPDGTNAMWSLWEPSPAELKILLEGGSVLLGVLGTVHPPVFLTVQPAVPAEEI